MFQNYYVCNMLLNFDKNATKILCFNAYFPVWLQNDILDRNSGVKRGHNVRWLNGLHWRFRSLNASLLQLDSLCARASGNVHWKERIGGNIHSRKRRARR